MKIFLSFILGIVTVLSGYGFYTDTTPREMVESLGSTMTGSAWFVNTSGQIQSVVATWGLRIPSLASSGNCLVTDANGVVTTSACGSGSGELSDWQQTNGALTPTTTIGINVQASSTISALNTNSLLFNTTTVATTSVAGLLQWNATDGTLDLGQGCDATLQIGQESFILARNNTGVTIDNGSAVYASGQLGNKTLIALAKGDAEATSHVIGVTTEEILDNENGCVTTSGYVRQIKTDYAGWTTGADLYVSTTTAGALIAVTPAAPNHSDKIGSVGIVGGAGVGSILIGIERHKSFEDLADVNGTALTTSGQIAVWDNTNQYFDFDYNITNYLKFRDASTTIGDGTGGLTIYGNATTTGTTRLSTSLNGFGYLTNGLVSATTSGATLTLARTGNSTYSTIQHLQNIFHSAGYVSGGVITDIGSGNVSVAAGTGLIRNADSAVAEISYFDWSASSTLNTPTNSYRYIGVEYNGGSPRIVSHTTYDWNFKTDFPLGNIVNTAGTLHIENSPFAVGDHAANMIKRDIETMPYERDMVTGGLILGETGTRNVTVSTGAVWQGLTRHALSAIDTSGVNSFTTWAYNGTSWNSTTSVTQWPNTQYNNIASGLVTMAANRYANLWFYLETDGGLHMVYGQNEYTSLGAAEAAAPPTVVPDKITVHSWLIGRIVFQKSAASASSVQSVYTTVFSASSASNHANLSNLAWTASGHTGTASTLAGFDGSGLATSYATTGSGNVVLSASPTFTGVAVFAGITGTNATTTNATSTSLFSALGTFTNMVVNTLATFLNMVVTGLLDVGGGVLEIPNGTAPTVDSVGELALDTTSNQLVLYGSEKKVIGDGNFYPAFTYATSTAWTGTTTIPLGVAYTAETWNGVKCFTDVGTLNVSFTDGTNRMNPMNASTTVGSVTLSTNNTFTASEKRYVEVGTPASSPTKISCTLSKSITAD